MCVCVQVLQANSEPAPPSSAVMPATSRPSQPQIAVAEARVPAWRLQMRTKMFKTAATIVLCYCFCWLPYSAISVASFFDIVLAQYLSDTVSWLKGLILFNVVLNPFLYGFQDVWQIFFNTIISFEISRWWTRLNKKFIISFNCLFIACVTLSKHV